MTMPRCLAPIVASIALVAGCGPALADCPDGRPAGAVEGRVVPASMIAPPTPTVAAVKTLASLPVKGRAPKTGYDRALFGTAWYDVDRNKCDTRNDVLRRDLTAITPTTGCIVKAGTLRDPYTNRLIHWARGPYSRAIEIDHVVSLSNAWQTGAQTITPERRLALANDPLNLLAVDGPTNQAKKDGDAATWLPPYKAYRCRYVSRQIAVKAKYGLWVTPAERDAMSRTLATCPRQTTPTR